MFGRKKDFSFKITERGSAGSERAGSAKGGRKMPYRSVSLRTRIEAIALAAVTVIATASVDWAAIVGKAESGSTLTEEQTLSGGGVLVQEVTSRVKYASLDSAYMMVKVEQDTPYTVDIYQGSGDFDPSTWAKNSGKSGSIATGVFKESRFRDPEDSERHIFGAVPLWTRDIGVYLTNTEKAAIVITFNTTGDVSYMSNSVQGSDGSAVNGNIFSSGSSASGASVVGPGNCLELSTSTKESGFVPSNINISGLDGYQIFDKNESKEYTLSTDPFVSREITLELEEEGGLTLLGDGRTVEAGTTTKKTTITAKADGVNTKTVNAYIREITGVSAVPYTGASVAGDGEGQVKVKLVCTGVSGYDIQYTGINGVAAEPVDAGDYIANVIGTGNDINVDFGDFPFTITAKALTTGMFPESIMKPANISVSSGPNGTAVVETFDGAKDGTKPLVLNRDFTATAVLDSEHTTSEKKVYKISVTGKGNYTGTLANVGTVSFTNSELNPVDISAVVSSIELYSDAAKTEPVVWGDVSPYTFDKEKHIPYVKILGSDGAELGLTKNTDYYISITKKGSTDGIAVYRSDDESTPGAINAGDYTVSIVGKGSYHGTASATADYKINKAQITSDSVVITLDQTNLVDTGSEQHPIITSATYVGPGKDLSIPMTENDYIAVPDDYRGVNDPTVPYHFTLTAVEGSNYESSASIAKNTYNIVASFRNAEISVAGGDYVAPDADCGYVASYDGTDKSHVSIAVRIGTKVLQEGESKDYTVSWSNATDATVLDEQGNKSTYVTITGKGTYATQDPIKVYFTITPKALPENVLNSIIAGDYIYTGEAIIPSGFDNESEPCRGAASEEEARRTGADYYITCENNINAGTATVTATGINNYTGTVSEPSTFTISPRSISSGDRVAAGFIITLEKDSYQYTGGEIKAKVNARFMIGSELVPMVEDTDYTLSYENNKDVKLASETGAPTVTITGKNNFIGSLSMKFSITVKTLENLYFTIGSESGILDASNINTDYEVNYNDTGYNAPPVVLFTDERHTTAFNTSYYKVTYPDSVTTGYNMVTITGLKNYAGSEYYLTYYVKARTVSDPGVVIASSTTKPATGTYFMTGSVENGTALYWNVKANSSTLNFDNNPEAHATDPSYDYYVIFYDKDGREIPRASAKRTETVDETKYTLYGAKAAGAYSFKIVGEHNYTGNKTQPYTVGKDISTATIKVYRLRSAEASATINYIGENYPAVGVEFGGTALEHAPYTVGVFKTAEDGADDADYKIEFVNGTTGSPASFNAGTHVTVKVTGNADAGIYYGTAVFEYSILPASLADAQMTGDNRSFSDPSATWDDGGKKLKYIYNGQTFNPDLTMTYEPEYHVSLPVNCFKGTLDSVTHKLKPVTLTQGRDFTIAPAVIGPDVVNDAAIALTGSGNFTGVTEAKYSIGKADLSGAEIAVTGSYTYNGVDQIPSVTVRLGGNAVPSDQYNLKYYKDEACTQEVNQTEGDMAAAGQYYIKAVASGDFYEETTETPGTFRIQQRSISGVTVSEISAQEYTAVQPADAAFDAILDGVEVIDRAISKTLEYDSDDSKDAGNYYRAAFKTPQDGTKAGKNTITLTGVGNYTGTKDVNYMTVVDPSAIVVSGFDDGETYYLSNDLKLYEDPGAVNPVTVDSIEVTIGSEKYRKGTDYTIKVVDGTNFAAQTTLESIGSKRIIVKGVAGSVCERLLENIDITVVGDLTTGATVEFVKTVGGKKNAYSYPGNASQVFPGDATHGTWLSVRFGNGTYPLVNGEDYTVTSAANTGNAVGTLYDVTIAAKDGSAKYSGTVPYSDATKYRFIYDLNKVLKKLELSSINYGDELTAETLHVYYDEDGDGDIGGGDTKLVMDTDFTITNPPSYTTTSNSNRGTVKVTFREVENRSYRSGTVTISGEVNRQSLEDADVTMENESPYTYNAMDQKPSISGVSLNGRDLVLGTDYVVNYYPVTNGGSTPDYTRRMTSTVNAGRYICEIKGTGVYTGTKLIEYTINPATITDEWVVMDEAYYAGGTEVTPSYYLMDPAGSARVNEADYEGVFSDNRSVGTAKLTIASRSSNYITSPAPLEHTFLIKNVDIGSGVVTVTGDKKEYTGSVITPTYKLTVRNGNNTYDLVPGTDFEASYTGPDGLPKTEIEAAGQYSVQLRGKDNGFTGTKTFIYEVTPKGIGGNTVDKAYDATTGSWSLSKTVGVLDEKDNKYSVTAIADQPYANGNEVRPAPESFRDVSEDHQHVMVLGVDYEIEYVNDTVSHSSDDTDGNAPAVIIHGIGNYGGYAKCRFAIGESLEAAVVTSSPSRYDYDGAAHVPADNEVSVVLNNRTLSLHNDYEVTFPGTDAVNAGDKDIVVRGTGGYWSDSTATGTYSIVGVTIRNINVTLNDGPDYYYNDGNEIRPEVTVSVDGMATVPTYRTEYKNNINVGRGDIKVVFEGNYNGEKTVHFNINPIDISGFTLTYDDKDSGEDEYDWTGNAIVPAFTIEGSDPDGKVHRYSSSDADIRTEKISGSNINPGRYGFTVKGRKNLLGALDTDFGIYVNLDDAYGMGKLRVVAGDAPYNDGNYTEPVSLEVTLGGNALVKDTDYIVWYDDNGNDWENGTTAHIAIEGNSEYIYGYVDDSRLTYRISDNIANFEVTGVATEYIYTGGPIRPAGLKVMRGSTQLTEGTDYTLSFRNNIFPGTATMTVTPKPAGTPVEKTFRILKENINNCFVGDIAAVTYNGSAQKPEIDITFGGGSLYEGTDYTVSFSNNTNPGTASVTIEGIGNFTGVANRTFPIEVINMTGLKAKQSGSKTTLTWTKKPNVTGYRIIYGTDFKNKQKVTQTTTSYSFSRTTLAKGDRVGIQGYVTVGGETTYGTPLIVTVQ